MFSWTFCLHPMRNPGERPRWPSDNAQTQLVLRERRDRTLQGEDFIGDLLPSKYRSIEMPGENFTKCLEFIHYIPRSLGSLGYNLSYNHVTTNWCHCLCQWKPRTPRSVLGVVDLAHIQGVLFGNADIRACVKPWVTLSLPCSRSKLMITTRICSSSNAIWLISVSRCFSQKLLWFVPLINLILIGGCVSVVSYWYFLKWMYHRFKYSQFLGVLNIFFNIQLHIRLF